MDISELMKLLKHESLYGGAYGVNAKQVIVKRSLVICVAVMIKLSMQ